MTTQELVEKLTRGGPCQATISHGGSQAPVDPERPRDEEFLSSEDRTRVPQAQA